MDDFVATYLMLGVALVLTVAGFWFKNTVLFIIAGLAWAMVGIYCISLSEDWSMVKALGYIGIAAALAMFAMPFVFSPKEIETPPPAKRDYSEELREKVDKYRKSRNRKPPNPYSQY